MEPRSVDWKAVPDPEYSRRDSERRWNSGGTWLPYGKLGSRTADAGGRGRIQNSKLSAVRCVLYRPLRRAYPRDDWHDGQFAVPQRRSPGVSPPDSLFADSRRGDGCGDVRQGIA